MIVNAAIPAIDTAPAQLHAAMRHILFPGGKRLRPVLAMAAAEASGLEFIGMPFTMVVAPGGELLKTHIGEIVEAHIEKILGVFEQLKSGEVDLAGARTALKDL